MIKGFTEVTLNDHRREGFAKFKFAIRSIDEVIECHLISGGYDDLLKRLSAPYFFRPHS